MPLTAHWAKNRKVFANSIWEITRICSDLASFIDVKSIRYSFQLSTLVTDRNIDVFSQENLRKDLHAFHAPAEYHMYTKIIW